MESKRIVQQHRPARNDAKAPGLANDCEIAARIVEGDRKALTQLVDRHMSRLYTYLLRRLGHVHDKFIIDVVDVTFNEALRRIKPYASGEATTPMDFWLMGLAEKHLAKVRPTPAPKTTQPQDTTEPQPPATGHKAASVYVADSSDLSRLRAAMSAIPNRYRAVLALALFEQLPAGEIAECLGVSPAAAMRKLRDALKRLNKALEEQEKH